MTVQGLEKNASQAASVVCICGLKPSKWQIA
jgi:hypothetical protein